MNLHLLSFVSATLLLVTGCTTTSDNSIPGATPKTFVGGPENLQLVRTATSITVFRIVTPDQKRRPKKLVTIDGRPCDASSVVVAGPEATQVIAALSDMSNFGGMYMCDFNPGIILRFASGERTLDLVICFSCGEMILYSNGELVRRPYKWASKRNSFQKDARRAFTAIAKKAFPNDTAIKALK